MAHYIALIHKEADSSYGVSFPDVPGVVTSGRSIDEAMTEAGRALAFAAEDWASLAGAAFPAPRTVDELREDPDFREAATDAVLAAVPLRAPVDAAA